MALIATSGNKSATARALQRHGDKTANGVRWAIYWDGSLNTSSSMRLRYSTDDGSSWTDPGAGSAFGFTGTGFAATPNVSLFIDADDYAHVAYKDANSGRTFYRRGTPNAARIAWTWSSAYSLFPNAASDYPDIVAFPSGAGWAAHVVLSSEGAAYHVPITIASGGSVTVGSLVGIGSGYGNTSHTFPSISFKHTGDGKTPDGDIPDLFAVWSAGATGAGKGIRLKRATGSTWAWGTERELDSTSYAASADLISSSCDGTRVLVAYQDATSTSDIRVRVRDTADISTTSLTPPALSGGSVQSVSVATTAGGVYLAAIGGTADDPSLVSYQHGSASWGAWSTLAAATADHLSIDRNPQGSLGAVYTDGASAPFNVAFQWTPINAAPNAPTPLSPAGGANVDRSQPVTLSAQFSDPDPGDSPSASQWRYRIRDIGATWTTVSQPNPLQTYTIAAGLAAGNYEWQAAYADQSGTWGPFCSSEFFTAVDPLPGPVWLDPAAGATIGTDSYTFVFSAPDVDESEFTLYADDGAGNIDTSTIIQGPATVDTGDVRRHTFTGLVNNVPVWASVRYKYQGLWSQPAQQRNPVSYTQGPDPVVVLSVDNPNGALIVSITNPAPGAGEPAASYNSVRIDDGDGKGLTHRIGSQMLALNTPYTYRLAVAMRDYTGHVEVTTTAENGTTSTTTA